MEKSGRISPSCESFSLARSLQISWPDWSRSWRCVAGTGELIGVVISFTETQEAQVGVGTLDLKYSCAALAEFVGGKINHKLSWERL